MCNTYTLRRDFVKTRWKGGKWNPGKLQFSQLEHGETWIIRPTRPAPVFLQDETCRLMRWGFVRPWAKAINKQELRTLFQQQGIPLPRDLAAKEP